MKDSLSLKQKYQVKKLNELAKKIKLADHSLMLEEKERKHYANLIMEALDQDEYEKATDAIKKLQSLSTAAEDAGLPTIKTAIDTSIKEINKFTGGGFSDRVKSRLASFFSKATPESNPILKGLSFVSALEKGFKVLPTILKNNIKDIQKSQDKKLSELATDDKVKKAIQDNVRKAFTPEGAFGKVFGKMPYIDNLDKVIEEMMESTPAKLAAIVKPATSGPQTSEIDPGITSQKENEKAAAGQEAGGKSGGKEAAPGKAPEGKAKEQNIKATQDSAKKAGIEDSKAITTLLDKLDYEVGSTEGSLVIPMITKLMAKQNIGDDQADGFIRGLMSDFDKDFKAPLQDAIKKEIEKKQAELEKAKGKTGAGGSAPAAPAGGGGQGGGAAPAA